MLTINRPFYEYRDIYLFIAVGLATFITTFVVLGVVSTINIDQLSRSTSSEATSVESTTTDATKEKGTKQNSATGASSNDQSRQSPTATSSERTSFATIPTTQSSNTAAPQMPAPSPQPSVGTPSSSTPIVVVQQPAPAPATPSNSGGGGESLINLPTSILPPLPLVGGLIDL